MRVLIADEYQNVLEALNILLLTDSSIQVVGLVTSGSALLDAIETSRPDVLLMEACSPDFPGIDLTRRIVMTWPTIAVILMAAHASKQEAAQAAQAGALAYLPIESIGRNLFDALWHVCGAASLVSGTSQVSPAGYETRQVMAGEPEPLSAIEEYLLHSWRAGLSTRQMALTVSLPCAAVEAYLDRIHARLRLNDVRTHWPSFNQSGDEGQPRADSRRPATLGWSPVYSA